jgi:quercetin dioxygenase-like cupin family protein
MEPVALPEVSAALLDEARTSRARRAARRLCGGTGHTLRQTVIALLSASTLSDHENPGEATLQVLLGTVRLTWPDGTLDLDAGAHIVIPDAKHGLLAVTDAVVLLTAANS